jgi:subtilisin family serine protease
MEVHKMLKIIKRGILILIILPSIAILLTAGISDLSLYKSPDKAKYTKIDTALYQFYQTYMKFGSSKALSMSKEYNIKYSDDEQINLAVHLVPSTTPQQQEILIDTVESIGGKIVGFNYYKEISIPVRELAKLSELDFINYIYPSRDPIELNDIISEGVYVTAADELQALPPYKNPIEKVKVAIIDVGFEGYQDLLGTELPNTVTAISFWPDGNLESSRHGSGCAEIVYDMAPDSDLYLLAVSDGFTPMYNAVQYCIQNSINVISISLGFYGTDAGDGTGFLGEFQRMAYENGIIWVSAAGNTQSLNWYGMPDDTDSDGWIEFAPGDEVYEFDGEKDKGYWVFLDWEDYGTWNHYYWFYPGSGEDFDLYLVQWDGNTWQTVNKSENVQNGDDAPIEELWGFIPSDGRYGLSIKRSSGTKNIKLHLTLYRYGGTLGFDNFEYYKPEESICPSATSRYTIAVGAFYHYNGELAPYSSFGPTRDGRIKPDITAPSHVSTFTYSDRDTGMGGTSAATPHVAGAVALLLSRLPFSTFEEVMAFLSGRAIDVGDPGKDNRWGYGRMYLKKNE